MVWWLAVLALGGLAPSPAAGRRRQPAVRVVGASAPLPGPRSHVLRLALAAYGCAPPGLFRRGILTIIDYTLPSTVPRLWVIDLAARRVLFNELVAHGVGSGGTYAAAFSNEPGSRQSSLGLFRTGDVYEGTHGESLRLIGLEPGFNDRALEREIVMHGAPYVSRTVVTQHGQLGRSWGCPALARGVERRVIARIRDGTALFVYYPDSRWLAQSQFLRCDPAARAAALREAVAPWDGRGARIVPLRP
jgi:hypothetical protein